MGKSVVSKRPASGRAARPERAVVKKLGKEKARRRYTSIAPLLKREVEAFVSDVHGCQPVPKECVLCGKKFQRARLMKEHTRSHLSGKLSAVWSSLLNPRAQNKHPALMAVVRAFYNHDTIVGALGEHTCVARCLSSKSGCSQVDQIAARIACGAHCKGVAQA